MWVLVRFISLIHFRQGCSFENVDYEYRMVCWQGASTLCNNIRMLYSVTISSFNKCIYTVVNILLYRVIDTALAVWRASAVIIDAQTASTIYETYIKAQFVHLDIELWSLTKSCLDTSYLCYLTANMEMNKLKTIFHSFLFKGLKSL